MNQYTQALGQAIVEHFESLLRDGKRPVGVRLMPAEVKVVREYVHATNGEAFVQPVGGGLTGPQILGLAIIEVARPIPVEDRFLLDEDERSKAQAGYRSDSDPSQASNPN